MLTITISTANPLDKQLKALTGDGWNAIDWERIQGATIDLDMVKHRKTGLVVKIQVDRTPQPVQEQESEPDIYKLFPTLDDDLHKNDRQWREINQESYWEMLDCLPPLAMRGIGFLSSEPLTDLPNGEEVYISCIEDGGQFFAAYLTQNEFKTASIAGIPKHEG